MDKKRDIFFDTKAGRAFLCLMSLLLIVGGMVILYLSFIEKKWEFWSVLLAVGIVVSGVCQILVCNRRRKATKD